RPPGGRERKVLDQRRGEPGDLLSLCGPRYPHHRTVERLLDLPGSAHRLEQFVHEDGSVAVSCHRARGGGVHHDSALRYTGWGKAAGDGAEAALIGVSSRRVENCDFDGSTLLVHL